MTFTSRNVHTHRRLFLTGTLAMAAMPASAGLGLTMKRDLDLFIGTYTNDSGGGIYPLSYSAATDMWQVGNVVPDIDNVSFAVYSPRFKRHYLLNEQEKGRVGAWIEKDGAWARTADVSSEGAWPCYAALSRDESALAVANYGTGNIVIYKLCAETGNPLEPPTVRQNRGSGPNTDRQEAPHAHWVQFSPDQTHIYSIDLGTDQILGYRYDAQTLEVSDAFTAYTAPAGSGPRHMVFHPDGAVAFLVTELDNQMISLKLELDGTLTAIQAASLLPSDFTGKSQAAHIAINSAGTRVYVSNRGHNSLAVFDVNGAGAMKLLQIAQTRGDWPRFFALYEAQQRLVIAHQNSHDLVVFSVNVDGTIMPSNQTLSVSRPVFIGAV